MLLQVYGREWCYGSHDHGFSGIFEVPALNSPAPAVYRGSLEVGDTDLCEKAVKRLLVRLGREFAGNRYHLLERNCNIFSEAFVRKLTGRPGSVPGWVNRVARLGSLLNTVAPCMLPAAVG